MSHEEISKVYLHHINCIYKCGMLLDEHVEILREFWRMPQEDLKENSWIVTALPLLCGGLFSFKMKTVFPLVLSSFPIGTKILKYVIKKVKLKKYIENFESMTDTLRKIFDFNKTIRKYYERRRSALDKLQTSTKVLIEEPIMYKLSVLINTIFVIMENLIIYIQNQLLLINEFIPSELSNIFNLDFEGKINWSTEGDLTHFETMQMCFVLATSTFLSGIGLVLCNSPEYIFKNVIPKSQMFIGDSFRNMKDIFEEITFHLPESEISHEKCVRTDSLVTISKFNESVQLTFYTGLALRECIIKGNEDGIRNHLSDLEKLFSENTNLLFLLQHEYKSQVTKDSKLTNFTEETVHNSLTNGRIVRYDDVDEHTKEQEFSLSIHGSDTEDTTEEEENVEYEQLREQVRVQKIIIKELNDELLRRKLIKEDFMEENKKSIKKSESPEVFFPENLSFNNMDFLAQIKEMAQNRGGSELVFGDEIESEENESSTE